MDAVAAFSPFGNDGLALTSNDNSLPGSEQVSDAQCPAELSQRFSRVAERYAVPALPRISSRKFFRQ